MNDSRRNRTLGYLLASENILIDKQSFDIAWNKCAQDVLDTLGDFSAAVAGCGDSSAKFDEVRQELAVYFARLNDTDNWIEP